MGPMRTKLASTLLLAFLAAAQKPAPKAELNLTDLNGKKVRLRDYRGQIVVLNFWATWCGPCKEEMPRMVEAEKEYKARGITFIAVSLDDSKTKKRIPEFVSQYQIAFPVWVGGSADDLAKLGMGEAVPDTAFIDQEGNIVARVLGETPMAELKERIEWLLSDRKGPAPEARVVHLDSGH
jgi:thiol-disulfide isomerase/thioredoxin